MRDGGALSEQVKLCVEPYVVRRGGRKPPLMAEDGQSILPERIVGVMHFMEAKELRPPAGR
jgi:hypothetical protein